MIDLTEFYTLMRFLNKAYPRHELEPETTEVYYQVLGDLPLHVLKAAILQLISEDSPWCPSAGQVRGRAFELLEREFGLPTALEAWGEVMCKVGENGYMRVPEFSNEIIGRAVKAIGGWRSVCMSREDWIHTTRARFVQAYQAFIRSRQEDKRMLPQVRELAAQLSSPVRLSQGEMTDDRLPPGAAE